MRGRQGQRRGRYSYQSNSPRRDPPLPSKANPPQTHQLPPHPVSFEEPTESQNTSNSKISWRQLLTPKQSTEANSPTKVEPSPVIKLSPKSESTAAPVEPLRPQSKEIEALLLTIMSFKIVSKEFSQLSTEIASLLSSKIVIPIHNSILKLLQELNSFLENIPKCIWKDSFKVLLRSFKSFLSDRLDSNSNFLELECNLFNLSYSSDPFFVSSLYQNLNELLTTESKTYGISLSNAKAAIPLIFLLRYFKDETKLPFNVFITNSAFDTTIISEYAEIITDEGAEERFKAKSVEKPVFMFVSAKRFIKIIQKFDEINPIFSRTRFCLCDTEEQTIEIDVLIALLSSHIQDLPSVGLKFVLFSSSIPFRYFERLNIHRVLNDSFSNQIKIVELIEVNQPSEIVYKASGVFSSVIDKILTGKLERGNILVFLPNVNSCKSFLENVSKNQSHFISVKESDTFETLHNEGEANGSPLMIAPFMLSEFSSPTFRKLAQTKFPVGSKVIKLVVTTSFMEYSLEIDNLVSVIDTGIFSSISFDQKLNFSTLCDLSISKRMRLARESRIGKARKGIFIQFDWKGQAKLNEIPPPISACYLSIPIISFRKLGIRIETLYQIDKKVMNDLTSSGFLDSKGDLTQFGRTFSQFTPFLASALSNFACDGALNLLFGALAIFIMTTDPQLIQDPNHESFIKNFCEESDIVTLMKTFLEFFLSEKSPPEFGFHSHLCCSLKKKFSSFMKKNNYTNEQIRKILNEKDALLVSRLDSLIAQISSLNPSWITCRQGSLVQMFIERFTMHGAFYESAKHMSFKVYQRPGATSWSFPMTSLFLFVEFNETSKLTSGAFLHRVDSKIGTIVSRKVPAKYSCSTAFFCVLFNSYWFKQSALVPIIYNPGIPKMEFIGHVHVDILDDNVDLSYFLLDESRNAEVINSIELLTKFMPFVPRSIIIHHESPSAVLELVSVGGDFSSYQYPIRGANEQLPHAYPCNKRTLTFLSKRLSELANDNPKFRFSLTGESFFQSFGEDQVSNAGWLIKYEPHFETVFIAQGNHLVILATRPSFIPDEETLEWESAPPAPEFEAVGVNLISAASKILPSIISARYYQNGYFLKRISGNLEIASGQLNTSVKLSSADIKFGNIAHVLTQFRLGVVGNESMKEGIKIKEFGSTSTGSLLKHGSVFKSIQTGFPKLEFKDFQMYKWGEDAFFAAVPRQIALDAYTLQDCFNFELRLQHVVPICFFMIYHTENLGLSPQQFQEAVQTVVEKFGFLVLKSTPYEIPKLKIMSRIGLIRVWLLDANFAVVFVKEIRSTLLKDTSDLSISSEIVPSLLQQPKYFDEAFKEWMKANDIRLMRSEDNLWTGKTGDVEKAKSLLGIRAIAMRHGLVPFCFNVTAKFREDLDKINMRFASANKFGHKWDLNYNPLSLVVPKEDVEEAKSFVGQYSEIYDLWDPGYCESPLVSKNFILVYEANGDFEMKPYCMDCQIEILKFGISPFAPNGKLDPDALALHQTKLVSPQVAITVTDRKHHIPIGQLLWQLSHSGDEIQRLTKLWVTGTFSVSLRTNPQVFTSCPSHPRIIHLTPTPIDGFLSCSVPACHMNYCATKCHCWHEGVCEYVWDGPKCPKCFVPTFKNQGCNHITCPCGAHWCYKCGAGPFRDASLTYYHMDKNRCWS